MSDDDTTIRDGWRDFAQAAGDIFVREAVKSVTPDAFAVEMFRDRVMVATAL